MAGVGFCPKIRTFLTTETALLVYKCTILPILEYADFVFDFDIQYLNNKLQTIQNTGLYIVYNQHYLPYDMKDSTETLHRRANLHRLAHRRRMHMLSFIYNYVDDPKLIDARDINTRRREGIFFRALKADHYKVRQDPLWRAIEGWNKLPPHIRKVETKNQLKISIRNSIIEPFKNII